MGRSPRLGAPGILHHVMARGIERREIFRDDEDRRAFVDRLEKALGRTGASLYAWCLVPNHFHLLARSGWAGVGRMMQSPLGGYAGAFNRRHHRSGHLFQNRFKSILVEEEAYLLELVRYIHLNPVRAGLLDAGRELDEYPWTGHSRLTGTVASSWQDSEFILEHFGHTAGDARKAYREFVSQGVGVGRRAELSEGRRIKWRPEGWEVSEGRGRERWAFDERVLGGEAFVKQVMETLATPYPSRPQPRHPRAFVRQLAHRTAERFGLSGADVVGRPWRYASVRAVVCHVAVRHAGLTLRVVAQALGVSPPTVLRGARSGESLLAEHGVAVDDLIAFQF